jgi:DNA modification methylase
MDHFMLKLRADHPMAQHIVLCSVDELQPYANNPRTHNDTQIEQIAASIAEFGFTNPILVDAQKGVVAGHGRLIAAQTLGLKQVPIIVLDHLSHTQRRAYLIADNKLTENGGWDFDKLEQELRDLEVDDFDIALTGFDWDEVFAGKTESTEDNSIKMESVEENPLPACPQQPITKLGDLWLLDQHRVLCADATVPASLEQLVGQQKVDLIFTDPPYNVDYEGYTEHKLTIQNDKQTIEDFSQFLHATFSNCNAVLKPDASLYVCHASLYQREVQNALEANGFIIRNQIIWAKNHFAWSYGRYKFQHEPIFYCHLKGHSDRWYGDKGQSTLWTVNKPTANRLHPTMKPLELIEIALKNSSREHDLVLDLFGGSGSTLVACEEHARIGYLLELDPRYVDVIIQRWQDFTGKEARRAQDNQLFNSLRTS